MTDVTPKFDIFMLANVVYRLNRITGETWILVNGEKKWVKVGD